MANFYVASRMLWPHVRRYAPASARWQRFELADGSQQEQAVSSYVRGWVDKKRALGQTEDVGQIPTDTLLSDLQMGPATHAAMSDEVHKLADMCVWSSDHRAVTARLVAFTSAACACASRHAAAQAPRTVQLAQWPKYQTHQEMVALLILLKLDERVLQPTDGAASSSKQPRISETATAANGGEGDGLAAAATAGLAPTGVQGGGAGASVTTITLLSNDDVDSAIRRLYANQPDCPLIRRAMQGRPLQLLCNPAAMMDGHHPHGQRLHLDVSRLRHLHARLVLEPTGWVNLSNAAAEVEAADDLYLQSLGFKALSSESRTPVERCRS